MLYRHLPFYKNTRLRFCLEHIHFRITWSWHINKWIKSALALIIFLDLTSNFLLGLIWTGWAQVQLEAKWILTGRLVEVYFSPGLVFLARIYRGGLSRFGSVWIYFHGGEGCNNPLGGCRKNYLKSSDCSAIQIYAPGWRGGECIIHKKMKCILFLKQLRLTCCGMAAHFDVWFDVSVHSVRSHHFIL